MPLDATRLSVVIPVYNAAGSLDALCRRIRETLETRDEPFEVVLVDDGSRDESWQRLQAIHASDPRLRIIQLMRNVGQFRAILCGLHHARGEVVVTMDDDLQHPPEEIPVLLDALRGRPDLDAVIGAPEEKQHAWYRNLGSAAVRRFNRWVFRIPKGLRMGSFRALRRPLVDALLLNRRANVTIGPLILSCTQRLDNVTTRHEPRAVGRSNYTLLRLVRTLLDNMVGYSTLPLKVTAGMGGLVAILAFLYGLYRIIMWYRLDIPVPGWTSTVVMISFFSGMILLCLALIGEYLIRIIRELDSDAQFVIREQHLD